MGLLECKSALITGAARGMTEEATKPQVAKFVYGALGKKNKI